MENLSDFFKQLFCDEVNYVLEFDISAFYAAKKSSSNR